MNKASDEIRTQRSALETEVFKIIADFEQTTGLLVSEINLPRSYVLGRHSEPPRVEIRIEVPR